jgi:hypothetical protein
MLLMVPVPFFLIPSCSCSCWLLLTDQRTRVIGTTGQGDCLAPPGYELVPGFAFITECEPGFYKPDWNRNPCTPVSNDNSRIQQLAETASTEASFLQAVLHRPQALTYSHCLKRQMLDQRAAVTE